MKNMKNIGRILLPIIILLLTVRINAVPVSSRIRKDICGMVLRGEACAVMMGIQ